MEIQQLKRYLKENHITYEELAARSNLSISTIKKLFSGISQYPRVDTIAAIEKALGIQPQWTDEEKAEGVGRHAVYLSPEEEDVLEMLNDLKRIKGEQFYNSTISLIKELIKK